jgi:hypothetical protein
MGFLENVLAKKTEKTSGFISKSALYMHFIGHLHPPKPYVCPLKNRILRFSGELKLIE